MHDGSSPKDIVGEGLSDGVDGFGGVAEDEPLGLASCALPFKTGHGASGMGVQAITGPAFELGGIVALTDMARARSGLV